MHLTAYGQGVWCSRGPGALPRGERTDTKQINKTSCPCQALMAGYQEEKHGKKTRSKKHHIKIHFCFASQPTSADLSALSVCADYKALPTGSTRHPDIWRIISNPLDLHDDRGRKQGQSLLRSVLSIYLLAIALSQLAQSSTRSHCSYLAV